MKIMSAMSVQLAPRIQSQDKNKNVSRQMDGWKYG